MSSELESDVCYCVYSWRHLMKSTEVTTGLAESNGSLLPGGWLKVTCGLSACTPGSAPGPTLGNEYGRTLPCNFAVVLSQVKQLDTMSATHKPTSVNCCLSPLKTFLLNIMEDPIQQIETTKCQVYPRMTACPAKDPKAAGDHVLPATVDR